MTREVCREAEELLNVLRGRGLTVVGGENGRLRVTPPGCLTDDERQAVQRLKSEILLLVKKGPDLSPNPSHHSPPFTPSQDNGCPLFAQGPARGGGVIPDQLYTGPPEDEGSGVGPAPPAPPAVEPWDADRAAQAAAAVVAVLDQAERTLPAGHREHQARLNLIATWRKLVAGYVEAHDHTLWTARQEIEGMLGWWMGGDEKGGPCRRVKRPCPPWDRE